MKTIVVGTDGSPSSMQAVEQAATWAGALQADLHIACAVRPPIEVASLNPMGAAFLPNWAEAANAEAAAAVARAAEVARQAGATAEGHVLNGEPATALIEFSERVGADLLVLGSKGMKGPARFLLGSVPNRCAHHANCSVLIVRTT